jgi:F0F1-type ATP synthase alpha subunit
MVVTIEIDKSRSHRNATSRRLCTLNCRKGGRNAMPPALFYAHAIPLRVHKQHAGGGVKNGSIGGALSSFIQEKDSW